jgi:hypothetical protein
MHEEFGSVVLALSLLASVDGAIAQSDPQLRQATVTAVTDAPLSDELSRARRAEELQRKAAIWLHEELGFPLVATAPRIEFVQAGRMSGLRHRDTPGDRLVSSDAETVAVYDDDTRTIYLPDTWTGEQSTEGSILVHETVHHLQNLSGQKFECPEAREEPAFAAQERWLRRFGGSLESDFGLDPFTVLARTLCLW